MTVGRSRPESTHLVYRRFAAAVLTVDAAGMLAILVGLAGRSTGTMLAGLSLVLAACLALGLGAAVYPWSQGIGTTQAARRGARRSAWV